MKLLFAGSFDPFTTGHADIVARALRLADSVVIAVGVNENKKCMFTSAERVEAISRYYSADPRIEVMSYNGLTVDLASQIDADALLRGVRSSIDFEFERNLADVNREIAGLDTVLLMADQKLQHISSSMVRELHSFGHSVKGMVIDTFNLE